MSSQSTLFFPFCGLDNGVHLKTIEHRQGLKVGCIEEIAFRKGYINAEQLMKIASFSAENDYCRYLRRLAEGTTIL